MEAEKIYPSFSKEAVFIPDVRLRFSRTYLKIQVDVELCSQRGAKEQLLR